MLGLPLAGVLAMSATAVRAEVWIPLVVLDALWPTVLLQALALVMGLLVTVPWWQHRVKIGWRN
jgi:hypothetical protein